MTAFPSQNDLAHASDPAIPSTATYKTAIRAFWSAITGLLGTDGTAATARETLGVKIGTDVQAYNANLAALTTSASQAEMEAGTEASLRAMSPLRVAQAIAALAVPGSSGAVKQIAYANKTDTFSMSGTTFTDITGLSVSITPTSASSKILIIAMISCGSSAAADLQNFKIIRGASTDVLIADTAGTRPRALSVATPAGAAYIENAVLLAVDSPATTSAVSYKIQMNTNGGTSYINRSGTDTDGTYSRAVSNIFAVEYQ